MSVKTGVTQGFQHQRWVVVGTVMTGSTLGSAMKYSFGIFLPGIVDTLDLSPVEAGWLGASVVLGNILFSVPMGWWFSRYRPWNLALVSLLSGGLFLLLQGIAPVFGLLLVVRILFGLSYIELLATKAVFIRQWFQVHEAMVVNCLTYVLYSVVIFIAILVAPLLLLWLDGWRNALMAFAAVYGVVAVVWVLFGRERITEEYRRIEQAQVETPILSLVRYKELWVAGFGFFTTSVSYYAFLTFWPTYALEKYDVPLKWTGLILAFSLLTNAPTSLLFTLVPSLGNRKREVMVICSIALVAGSLGMLLTGSFALLFLLGILLGIGRSFWPVLTTVLYEIPGIKPRETAIGYTFLLTTSAVGAAVGPVLAGFLQETTNSLLLSLMVCSSFAGLLLPVGLALRPPAIYPVRVARVSMIDTNP